MTLVRCKASMTIHLNATDQIVELGAPMEVDLDRELVPAAPGRPAYLLGHAIAGREDCFETLDGNPILNPHAPDDPTRYETASAAPGFTFTPAPPASPAGASADSEE